MRLIILFFSIILTILSFYHYAFAENSPYSDQFTLISDKTSINFGAINPNETKYESITLINNSYEQVNIYDMVTEGSGFFIKNNTCPQTLDPDERCVVVLGFSSEEPGIHKGYFKVFTERYSVTVSLTGSVTKGIPKLVTNKDTIDFGDTLLGEKKYESITLTNIGKSKAIIRDIEIEGKGFSIKTNTCSNFEALDPNQECSIILSFSGEELGSYSGYLKIFSDNFTLPIKLTGTVVGNISLSLSESSVDFGLLPVGEKKTKTIYIRNNGNVPITIIGIDGIEEPYFSSFEQTTIEPKEVLPIKITFSPKEIGEYDFDIKFITNLPNFTKIIHLKGKAVENDINAIFFSKNETRIAEVNFGNVFILSSKEQTITLNNPTLDDIEIVQVQVPKGFQIFPQNFVIPHFSKRNIKLRFSPSDEGVYSGIIQFITSKGRIITLLVRGKGVNFNFLPSGGQLISYQVNSTSLLLNKPPGVSPIKTIGFYAYNLPTTGKIHIKLKVLMPYLSNITIFKITPTGSWVKLPFNPKTNEVEYDIYDNGQLDWDLDKGIIKDPVVIATKSSFVPPAKSGASGGGGCSLMTSSSIPSGILNMILPFLGIFLTNLLRRKIHRR